MGKHGRRSGDKPKKIGNGPVLPENHTPEQAAAHLDGSYGYAVTRVADKRLKGEEPYDLEPGVSGPPVRDDDE